MKLDNETNCGLNRYKIITVFNETGTFIPMCMLLFSIFLFSVLYPDQEMKDLIFVIAVLMCFIFIPIYIICGLKVHKYNKYLKNSIIIRKVKIEKIDFIMGGGTSNLSSINVYYRYIAPNGVEYEGNQKAKLFWKLIEPNQQSNWKQILQYSNDISVLICNYDYSKSYLPLCEEYCLRYNKTYVVHLISFYEDLTI